MPVEAQTQKDSSVSVSRWDDANAARWDADFKVVDIPSKTGGDPQKAYIYKASEAKRPLIVSLHTWSGDYRQADPLAAEAKAKDYNYIHPDFQGANTRPEAMGSELVVKNLQEAIEYAVKATEANPQEVHVIGVSGGGMAALLAYMNVTCAVKSFSAWAPIATPRRLISAIPLVISAAFVLSPQPSPSAVPAARAMTFFNAPPSSIPRISGLV